MSNPETQQQNATNLPMLDAVDTHFHLDMVLERLELADWNALAVTFPAQVEGAITVACHPNGLEPARLAAEAVPGLWFAAGLHPHDATLHTQILQAQIAALMSHPRCVAWGECGLDYHYDHSPRELQREVFRLQIEGALAYGKPLVVHAREADDDAFAMLRDLIPAGHKVHVHCYTGSAAFAEQLLQLPLDLCLGFTGILTFPSAQNVRDAAALVPLDRLLLETDAPFLAPIPYRGKVCHPGMLHAVAERLATVKGVALSELLPVVRANTRRIYGI